MTVFKPRTKQKPTYDTWQCHVHLRDGRSAFLKKDEGFCADPFLLREDTVLFEYYCFKESRGWIEVWNLSTGKSYKVFDNGVHSSFPFLFSINGTDYVMPEQKELCLLEAMPIEYGRDGSVCVAENRTIKLCTGVPIVDAMLVQHQERWYCLYNEDIGLIGDPGGTLLLSRIQFETQGLDTQGADVLSSDYRTARNGGSVWSKRGAIYRVFQHKRPACYGNGIGIERIQTRSKDSEIITLSNLGCPPSFEERNLNILSHHLDIKSYGMAWDARPEGGVL